MNKTAQRTFIWVMAIAMVIGTIGMFFAIILENSNRATLQEEQLARQQAQPEALPGYPIEKFDEKSVEKLQTKDLRMGDGEEVKVGDTITVNYVGYFADGSTFDGTNKGGTVVPTTFPLTEGGLIEGWVKGIPGMKVGGVRQLVIPGAQAYGESGSSDGSIPPNTPIGFVVEVVEIQE